LHTGIISIAHFTKFVFEIKQYVQSMIRTLLKNRKVCFRLNVQTQMIPGILRLREASCHHHRLPSSLSTKIPTMPWRRCWGCEGELDIKGTNVQQKWGRALFELEFKALGTQFCILDWLC
jgi:hypothetical protein